MLAAGEVVVAEVFVHVQVADGDMWGSSAWRAVDAKGYGLARPHVDRQDRCLAAVEQCMAVSLHTKTPCMNPCAVSPLERWQPDAWRTAALHYCTAASRPRKLQIRIPSAREGIRAVQAVDQYCGRGGASQERLTATKNHIQQNQPIVIHTPHQ